MPCEVHFKHGRSGYHNWQCRCDICCASEHAHYEANKQRISKWATEYAKTEKRKQYMAAYGKERRSSNRAEENERTNRWRRETAAGRLKIIRERGRKAGAPYSLEAMQYLSVIKADPCPYCNGPTAPTVDHIVPLTKGGTGDWDNLTAACRSCNAKKNNRGLLQFLLAERVQNETSAREMAS